MVTKKTLLESRVKMLWKEWMGPSVRYTSEKDKRGAILRVFARGEWAGSVEA